MSEVSCVYSFGEHWETGIEIQYKVGGLKYWKSRLHREISRCLSLRDRKGIAHLIRESIFLRNPARETYFTSKSMMMIMTGLVMSYPDDHRLILMGSEFLRSLPNLQKVRDYKLILNELTTKPSHLGELDQILMDVAERAQSHSLEIKSSTEYGIVLDMASETSHHIALFRADPCYTVDIMWLAESLAPSDWIHLVNRIDRIQTDIESWKALYMFLDGFDEDLLTEIHKYVSTYWAKYHTAVNLPPEAFQYREEIFRILHL